MPPHESGGIFFAERRETVNTQYFVYALEVARTGSITQAADNLYMGQPSLSKAIKDLEEIMGFTIFRRSSKGMVPTAKGEEFLTHARKIVNQLNTMELALHEKDGSTQLFSLAMARSQYMMQATSQLIATFDSEQTTEVDILVSNSMRVIEAVAEGHYVLGLIHCHQEDAEYFLKSVEEKGLQFEDVWQSDYVLLMNRGCPLAAKNRLSPEDLVGYTELVYGDEEVPFIRVSQAGSLTQTETTARILVYDRAMQTQLLRDNPHVYMLAPPMTEDALNAEGLVQRRCVRSGRFRDILISRSGYRFSKLDRDFLDKLYLQKNNAAYTI